MHEIDYISTHSGRRFHFMNPDPDEITIGDIAHALSNMCRFTGHVSRFFSVAQHSVNVAKHFEDKDRMPALLHDAAEAFFGDIAKPIKRIINGPITELEERVANAVSERFGLGHDFANTPEIHKADQQELVSEGITLMEIDIKKDWGIEPMGNDASKTRWGIPMPPQEAKSWFLAEYHRLKMLKL